MKPLENKIYEDTRLSSIMKGVTTLGTITGFSAYFFTRGYIHSFQLPITVDFLESIYFFLNLIADSIFPFISSIITNIWFMAIISIAILIYIIKLKLQLLRIFKLFSKIKFFKKITPPMWFFIGFIFFIFIVKTILDLNDYSDELSKIRLNLVKCKLTESSYNKIFCSFVESILVKFNYFYTNTKSFILFVALILITLAVPAFVWLFSNNSHFFKRKNILLFIILILISLSSSYYLGERYLPNFIHYPKYRVSRETKERKIQVWKGTNYYFYVKCKRFGVSFIEGVNKNDKVFYVSYINKRTHKNICR